MSILSKYITNDKLIKILKNFLIIIILFVGIFIGTYLLLAIFNLGVYLGTFLRNLYGLVCC